MIFANPDTKLEINLMLKRFARENNMSIYSLSDESDVRYVEFANGEVIKVSGKVVVGVKAAFQKFYPRCKRGLKVNAHGQDRMTPVKSRNLSTFYLLNLLVHLVVLS